MTHDRSASIPEFGMLRTAAERYDVAILGGGLAGLTLALQLKAKRPDTSIAVLEKRDGPAPEAAFKVGESTVPSGAHYFSEVVRMKDHLEARHLKKCGLRFFFPVEGNTDITRRIESGPPAFPPHDNFQIDRGRFENELAARCRRAGIDLLQGCRVGEVDLAEPDHTVHFTQQESEQSLRARWVVDAAGRASLLKRKLGGAREVGHKVNSAWFRLAGGLDLEQWGSDNADWMGRMTEPGLRMFSTNHLLGDGYWVWLIPLASGPISIGVCADAHVHPYEQISDFDSLVSWLGEHEPQLAAAIEPRRTDVEDFLRVENYSYGCERAYSPDRWCLVGEAAAFADPLYSPGSDFIGYGNCFTTELVSRELDGEDIRDRLEYFNELYLRTFRHSLGFYEGQFSILGNPQVAVPKVVWDGTLNHWAPTLLMVNNKLADFDFMATVDADLDRGYRLNQRMQRFLAEWSEQDRRPAEGVALESFRARPFIEALVGVAAEYDDDGLRAAMARHADMAEAMAVRYFHKAASRLSLPVDEDRPVNPYAIGLDPDRWEDDGLFDPPGLTLDQATELAPGVEIVWMDEVATGSP